MIPTLFILATATASIAFTVTEMKIFRGFRERMKETNSLLGELFSCSYCLGHWVAFVLVPVYGLRLMEQWTPLDYFLTALVVAWIAAAECMVMCCLMDQAGK